MSMDKSEKPGLMYYVLMLVAAGCDQRHAQRNDCHQQNCNDLFHKKSFQKTYRLITRSHTHI